MDYSIIKRFRSFNEEIQPLHLIQKKINIIFPYMESKINLLQNIYDLTLDLQDEEVKVNSRVFFIDSNTDIFKHHLYLNGPIKDQYIPFKSNKGDLQIDINKLWIDAIGIKESWFLSDESILEIKTKKLTPYTATFFWSMAIDHYQDKILSIGDQIREILDIKCKIFSNSGVGIWIVC